jgi:hypothetical protein
MSHRFRLITRVLVAVPLSLLRLADAFRLGVFRRKATFFDFTGWKIKLIFGRFSDRLAPSLRPVLASVFHLHVCIKKGALFDGLFSGLETG